MEKLTPYAHLLGRVLLALIFVLAGFGKITGDPAGTMQYMEAQGVPGFLFWPAALFELLAGLAILIGFQTRVVAFLLAGFCGVTAIMFHANFADQMQMGMFMKNFGMAGGFLVLMAAGAGQYSLDAKRSATV
ncbi:DoxX family protein [Kordiimonas aestuarii]|uniref:DoxX family protein n=1 Tax=Kordiimonas aestuarii TaxID=1005925 RepID=UPI0021CE81E0|nr:DoxX family protein [Kordiimonas aestuarii]